MGPYAIRSLKTITALSWIALIAEGALDILNAKGFAVLCAVSALAPVLAAIGIHSARMERATKVNTQRLEEATCIHIERLEQALDRLGQKVADYETVFQKVDRVWSRAHASVDQAAARYGRSPADTGPFQIYRGG